MKIEQMFRKPCIMGIVGDTNVGKSNAVHVLIQEIRKLSDAKIYTYGLNVEDTVSSLTEIETIRDSFIFIDEFVSLFELDNRRKARTIERMLRLIHHNNNRLVLIGLPENFKKFIAERLDIILYKQTTLKRCINGSRVKQVLEDYRGEEMGSTLLSLEKYEGLLYAKNRFKVVLFEYLEKFDAKKDNVDLFENVTKNVQKNCSKKNVTKNVTENVGGQYEKQI